MIDHAGVRRVSWRHASPPVWHTHQLPCSKRSACGVSMRSTQWLAFPALMLPALAVPPPYIALRGTSPMKWYSVLGDWEEPGFTCTDVFEGELGPKYVTMSPTHRPTTSPTSNSESRGIAAYCLACRPPVARRVQAVPAHRWTRLCAMSSLRKAAEDDATTS